MLALRQRPVLLLSLLLVVLGLLLFLTRVRGVFLVDENNYLVSVVALRHGQLTVPGTEGLTPSPELEYFDSNRNLRPFHRTPVMTSAPPLYAVLAWPFSFLGWDGLVLLNTISFLGCALMVFLYTRLHAQDPRTPWLAAATYVVGGYSIEYAQGMWPHMLSAALCTGGLLLSDRTRTTASPWLAAASGLALGFAVGVRHQNLVLAACVGLGVFLSTRPRWHTGAAYVAGLAGPLLAAAAVNRVRLGWFNPVKRHHQYLKLNPRPSELHPVLEAFAVLWSKLVDFSFHRPFVGPERQWMRQSEATGAFVYLGPVKKALLQSAPWAALSLVALAGSWGKRLIEAAGQRRELRAISIMVAGVLLLFSATGFQRSDGLCFNQRYLLELVPALAVALAWSVERLELRLRPFLLGAAAAAALVVPVVLLHPDDPLRQLVLLKAPLAFAALLVVGWAASRTGRAPLLLAMMLGASLTWALGVHLGDDLVGSRTLRSLNAERLDAVRAVLPAGVPSAVFAHWVNKDAMGPLHLERDVVVLDTSADEGRTAPTLVDDLLRRGRRVFVFAYSMPEPILRDLLRRHRYRLAAERPFVIVEILGPA